MESTVPVCAEVRELRDKDAATVSFLSLLWLLAEHRVYCRLSGFNCGALPYHQPEFLLTGIECVTVREKEWEREREIGEGPRSQFCHDSFMNLHCQIFCTSATCLLP